jgi:Arc-like DNA binding domain
MAQDSERRAVLLRRFPEDLHQELAKEAEASERTVPAEIIYRLRASLRSRKPEEAVA